MAQPQEIRVPWLMLEKQNNKLSFGRRRGNLEVNGRHFAFLFWERNGSLGCFQVNGFDDHHFLEIILDCFAGVKMTRLVIVFIFRSGVLVAQYHLIDKFCKTVDVIHYHPVFTASVDFIELRNEHRKIQMQKK